MELMENQGYILQISSGVTVPVILTNIGDCWYFDRSVVPQRLKE